VTLSELRELVSYWVDDIQQSYFTPVQLNVFLNRALREVQKYIIGANQDFWVKCSQTTLVVNQRDYVLPEDFKKLNRLEVVLGGTYPNEQINPLAPITLNQKDFMANVGVPQAYFFKNNRIVLWPAPSSALTLRLYYTYKVADMLLDVDVPDCPEEYHEMIAILAGFDAYLKDARDATLLVRKFDDYISRLKADADQRNIDQSRAVIESGQYDGGWDEW
jgi:hypothetical protein